MNKYRFIILAGILFVMSTCLASESFAAQGRITVTPDKTEFGEVEEGRIITAVAIVENQGSGTVQISNIRTN